MRYTERGSVAALRHLVGELGVRKKMNNCTQTYISAIIKVATAVIAFLCGSANATPQKGDVLEIGSKKIAVYGAFIGGEDQAVYQNYFKQHPAVVIGSSMGGTCQWIRFRLDEQKRLALIEVTIEDIGPMDDWLKQLKSGKITADEFIAGRDEKRQLCGERVVISGSTDRFATWFDGNLYEYFGESHGNIHTKSQIRIYHFEKGVLKSINEKPFDEVAMPYGGKPVWITDEDESKN